jgi:hypothetical protein
MLSDTQDRVGTTQLVLSKVEHGLETVEHGLETVEKLEAVAKHTRPVLRSVSIVILGCLVALAIGLLIRRRRGGYEIEIQNGHSPDEGPSPTKL